MDRKDETKTVVPPEGAEPHGEARDVGLAGPHLEPGATVGRYMILYRVGSGGMGVIYAAYDPRLDRKVALKILRSDLDSPGRRELLRREAKAMARLDHPHVVGVYDVGEDRHGIFLAMEYVEGRTLRGWLEDSPRSWKEILEVFLQAGHGLAAAHAAGLVHQDFKPSNVLLSADGEARVTDFGLAQIRTHGPAEASEDVPGSRLLGTPAYLAPERSAGHGADVLSDQFSFCAALYHAFFGQLPFEGSDSGSYLEAARRQRIRPPPSDRGVPRRVQRALWRGLSADPGERYRSVSELLQDLSSALLRPRRLRLALAVAVLVLVTAVATYTAVGRQPGERCTAGSKRMEGVWGEERRELIREAISATRTPFAGTTLGVVEAMLDRYREEWLSMHSDTCAATYVRGEQSERMLDLRMGCLDDRLAELRALTEELSRADREVAVHAVDAVRALRSVAVCADRPELDRLRMPRLDEEDRRTVEDARTVIETQFALMRTGRPIDQAAVERSAATALELSHPSLAARAFQLLSRNSARHEGDLTAAERFSRAALRASIEAGDRPLQVILFAALGELVGLDQGRPEESRIWFDLGEAALEALGPGHEEEAISLQHTSGAVALQAGDFQEAVTRLQRAYDLSVDRWGPGDQHLMSLLTDLGLALAHNGDPEGGVDLLERSVAVRERAGTSNPLLGPPLVSLASLKAELGHYQEALEILGRAREILDAFYGEGHYSLSYPELLTGEILLARDQPAAARVHLERSEPAIRKSFGEHHPLTAAVVLALAEAALLERRYDETAELLDSAERIELPGDHPLQGTRDLVRGRYHLETGDFVRAETELRRAAVPEREAVLTSPERACLHISLGNLLLRQDELEKARSEFERALKIGEGRDPHLVAEARFGLARVLLRQSDPRALDLARRAQAALGSGSPRTRELRRVVDRWLARHESSRGGARGSGRAG
jgi:tetratricopeptide (TPR) repeat protein/predicted Ser/Thr protein kinase